MTTAACPSPSTARTTPARNAGRHAGTRITTLALALRRWRERRDLLIPVGPEPAGPWAGSDRPDRDRIRMLADLGPASRR